MKTLALLFVAAAIGVSAAMSQETAAKPAMKAKEPLKSVSCAPECGFMVRSHDEKELSAIVIDHAKKHHNKTVTEKDVMSMMKVEPEPAAKPDAKMK
jgi:predicted small metal-binding protein